MLDGFDLGDLVALTVAVTSAGWVWWRFTHTSRKESVERTLALFDRYNAPDMLRARAQAWECLTALNESRPLLYSRLWSQEDVRPHYNDIFLVLSFWHSLAAADRHGLVDRKLTRSLLEYHFTLWREKLRPLAEDTRDQEPDFDPVLKPYVSRDLDWLGLKRVVVDPTVETTPEPSSR